MGNSATLQWGALLALCLTTGCTLTPGPAPLKLELKLPPKTEFVGTGGQRRKALPAHPSRGPELGEMTCFALIVNGAPGYVAAGEVGGRIPACLQMDGAFFGPYSYESLQSGVAITLPGGVFSMQLLGISGLSSCSETLTQIFAGGSTPQVYEVARAQPFNFPETSTVTLDGTKYSAATATDIVPSCAPQSNPCQGFEVCDTFSSADGAYVGNPRLMNTGQSWSQVNSMLSAIITNQTIGFSATVADEVTPSFMTMDSGFQDVEVVAEINRGVRTGNNYFRVIARHISASDFAYAEIFVTGAGTCGGGVYRRVAGATSSIDSGSLNCAELTGGDGYATIKVTTIGDNISLRIGEGTAYTYFGGTGVSVLTGTRVGLGARGSGTLVTPLTARVFKARSR